MPMLDLDTFLDAADPASHNADLSRIKSAVLSPEVAQAGAFTAGILASVDSALAQLQPGDRGLVAFHASDHGVILTAATRSADGRFRLAAFFAWEPTAGASAGVDGAIRF